MDYRLLTDDAWVETPDDDADRGGDGDGQTSNEGADNRTMVEGVENDEEDEEELSM